MKKIITAVLILTFFISCNSGAQNIRNADIIGMWTISSHQSTTEDGSFDLKFREQSGRTYTFNEDGTFMLKFFGKAAETNMTGKWKLNASKKTLQFSEIDLMAGAPPPFTKEDSMIAFKEFSDSTFSIIEEFYGDLKSGLSIYKKIK